MITPEVIHQLDRGSDDLSQFRLTLSIVSCKHDHKLIFETVFLPLIMLVCIDRCNPKTSYSHFNVIKARNAGSGAKNCIFVYEMSTGISRATWPNQILSQESCHEIMLFCITDIDFYCSLV